MASFVANLFSSSHAGKDKSNITVDSASCPSTPVKNDFLTPVDTPHGSPSKKVVPPGAYELPASLDSMRLDPAAGPTSLFGSPVKLGGSGLLERPQSMVVTGSTPLGAACKTNILPPPTALDDSSVHSSPAAGVGSAVDDSIIHKASAPGGVGSSHGLLKKQGQENTPPHQQSHLSQPLQPGSGGMHMQGHAAVTRQELYQVKEKATASAKKFNTSRGLTPEELEIINKPSVKRLVNVTQLCGWCLRRCGEWWRRC